MWPVMMLWKIIEACHKTLITIHFLAFFNLCLCVKTKWKEIDEGRLYTFIFRQKEGLQKSLLKNLSFYMAQTIWVVYLHCKYCSQRCKVSQKVVQNIDNSMKKYDTRPCLKWEFYMYKTKNKNFSSTFVIFLLGFLRHQRLNNPILLPFNKMGETLLEGTVLPAAEKDYISF